MNVLVWKTDKNVKNGNRRDEHFKGRKVLALAYGHRLKLKKNNDNKLLITWSRHLKSVPALKGLKADNLASHNFKGFIILLILL